MAARKARKPKHQKSEYPTLSGQLGYLNSYYCPVCGKHLFSAYDKDMKKDREDGYYFHVSNDFNYCSKCGQLLDLDEWKRKEEPPEAAVMPPVLHFSVKSRIPQFPEVRISSEIRSLYFLRFLHFSF